MGPLQSCFRAFPVTPPCDENDLEFGVSDLIVWVQSLMFDVRAIENKHLAEIYDFPTGELLGPKVEDCSIPNLASGTPKPHF